MTRINIRPLIHFLAVMDERSLGRAARRVNLSQPALSKSIRQLEASLGVELFERSPLGMKPTNYSTLLAERARIIVVEVNNAEEEIDRLRDRWRGSVSVGAGPSIVGALLANATADLKTRHPGLRVTIIEGLLENHLPNLINGSLDFVIGTAVEPALSHVISEKLFVDSVVVVARAGHPLAKDHRIGLDKLSCLPFVLTRAPDAMRLMFERRLAEFAVDVPQDVVETNSIQFMKALVAMTDYLAYLPRLAIQAEVRNNQLSVLSCPNLEWQREVHILTRARGGLSPAARAILSCIKQTYRYTDLSAPSRFAVDLPDLPVRSQA